MGEKPWFGPKRFGWGWAPASWEGWLATAVLLAAAGGATFQRGPLRPVVLGVTVVVLLLLVRLKGTSAGGSKEFAAFRRRRRGGPYVHGDGDDTPSLEAITRHYDEQRSASHRRPRAK